MHTCATRAAEQWPSSLPRSFSFISTTFWPLARRSISSAGLALGRPRRQDMAIGLCALPPTVSFEGGWTCVDQRDQRDQRDQPRSKSTVHLRGTVRVVQVTLSV